MVALASGFADLATAMAARPPSSHGFGVLCRRMLQGGAYGAPGGFYGEMEVALRGFRGGRSAAESAERFVR